ncbi:MAG: DUF4912 domain-containing protein [Thermodesulfobacteriota bacterium]|nr:DUF4912 domain-containing protein [Thermodesulfobacteriota bacterium]
MKKDTGGKSRSNSKELRGDGLAVTQKVEKRASSKAKDRTGKGAEKPAGDTVEAFCALHDAAAALSDPYGETGIVAVAVHPYLIHVYWEVRAEKLNKAGDKLGEDGVRARPVLRFYDVTGLAFQGGNANHAFDVDIDLASRSRYVELWSPGRKYLVELGLRKNKGGFYPVARSNVAETPRAAPSPQGAETGIGVRGSPEQVVAHDECHGGPRHDSPNQLGRAGPRPDLRKEGRNNVKSFQGYDVAQPQLAFKSGGRDASQEGPGIDLTDMSEKGFVLGLSS